MFICITTRQLFRGFLVLLFLLALILTLIYSQHKPASSREGIQFRRVTIDREGLIFQVPVSTILGEGLILSEEILFHMDFHDPVLNFHGFLERWNLRDLEEFLGESKMRSGLDIKDYNCRFDRRKKTAEVTYSQSGKDDMYLGKEFYSPAGKGQYYRWAFFLPTGKYKSGHEQIFQRIVSSFRSR